MSNRGHALRELGISEQDEGMEGSPVRRDGGALRHFGLRGLWSGSARLCSCDIADRRYRGG
jgi:hypothetical protein